MTEIEQAALRKEYAIAYLGGCCIRCGSKDRLEFDHKDPNTKIYNITNILTRDITVFMIELDKCQLLCRDCHFDKTHEENGHKKHGTVSMYMHGKCRCDECRAVYSKWNHDRRYGKVPC